MREGRGGRREGREEGGGRGGREDGGREEGLKFPEHDITTNEHSIPRWGIGTEVTCQQIICYRCHLLMKQLHNTVC